MDETFPSRTQARKAPLLGVRTIIGAAVSAFLLGGVATWLALSGGNPVGEVFEVRTDEPPSVAPAPTVAPTEAPAEPAADDTSQRVEQVVEQQGGLDQRIAAMEQRLARLDLQAAAAAGNAARAESLLIAFAARRAIERGLPLGYLEDQLRLRFSEARPDAVETVIAASRDPVTLDQLLARLDGLAPRLTGKENATGLAWLSRELGELFVVRREDAPSPAPERRLDRARLFLESGRAGAAASEIRMLPETAGAGDWIADAERYASVQRALELLELSAILEPRDLRDAAGDSVVQPSPLAR